MLVEKRDFTLKPNRETCTDKQKQRVSTEECACCALLMHYCSLCVPTSGLLFPFGNATRAPSSKKAYNCTTQVKREAHNATWI